MRIIEPLTIDTSNLVTSNITDSLPNAVSAVGYTAWDAATTYAASAVVISAFNQSGFPNGVPDMVGVFTSRYASNVNFEPFKFYDDGGSTQPGRFAWSPDKIFSFGAGKIAPIYNAASTYGVGAVVGYINGATGAFYTSLVAGNVGHTPSSSPTYWRQSTLDSYATWSGATTYAVGDRVTILFGTLGKVYRSLQATNLNHTPSSSPTWWAYEGDAYKTYNVATTYALGDVVNDPTTFHNYESLVASNLGNALTDEAKWLDRGASNRWAMFDLVNGTQTSAVTSIDFTVKLSTLADGLALMNMVARTVQVIATEAGTQVYNRTFDLNDNSFVTDWRHYFFDPITNKADLVLLDLPLSTNLLVQVIITNPSSVAKCGAAVFGRVTTLGGTVYGATTGILDYSLKSTNAYGDATLLKRAYSKRASFKLWVRNEQKDAIENKLASVRATPTIYIGTDEYSSTWVFGFFRDFSTTLDYVNYSYTTIEIEGLT